MCPTDAGRTEEGGRVEADFAAHLIGSTITGILMSKSLAAADLNPTTPRAGPPGWARCRGLLR